MVPRHWKWCSVYDTVQKSGETHHVDREAVSHNRGSRSLLQEHTKEEGKRDLRETPSNKNDQEEPFARDDEHVHLEDICAKHVKYEAHRHIINKIKRKINYPVVIQKQPIDLHRLDQPLFLLEDDGIHENWQAHAQTKWNKESALFGFQFVDEEFEVQCKRIHIDSSLHCGVIKVVFNVSLVQK